MMDGMMSGSMMWAMALVWLLVVIVLLLAAAALIKYLIGKRMNRERPRVSRGGRGFHHGRPIRSRPALGGSMAPLADAGNRPGGVRGMRRKITSSMAP